MPVIASRIPGNVGMLGRDYPGYYPVEDEQALALMLQRAETDAAFRGTLEERCAARRHLTLPERERGALGGLVAEVAGGSSNGRTQEGDAGVILASWMKKRV